MGCSPPGFSVHEISQTRTLGWVAIPFPGDLPDPRIEPTSPALAGEFFTTEPPGKPPPNPWRANYYNPAMPGFERQETPILRVTGSDDKMGQSCSHSGLSRAMSLAMSLFVDWKHVPHQKLADSE